MRLFFLFLTKPIGKETFLEVSSPLRSFSMREIFDLRRLVMLALCIEQQIKCLVKKAYSQLFP